MPGLTICLLGMALLQPGYEPVAPPQTPTSEDLLGMTPLEAVLLGRKAFMDRFIEKHGPSTPALSGAEAIYGQALYLVNEQRADRFTAAERAALPLLRRTLDDVFEATTTVGRGMTGGGTMWNSIISGGVASREEVIQELRNTKRVRPAVAFARAHAAGLARIRSSVADIDDMAESSNVTSAQALALWGRIPGLRQRALKAAEPFGLRGRRLVDAWVVQRIELDTFADSD
ncbi:MAG: hypothetical protein MH204_01535 [Fimbriimonadaceae bacterium]|nr:hypothetical protein [Fimbriimonadaceae bacterium]